MEKNRCHRCGKVILKSNHILCKRCKLEIIQDSKHKQLLKGIQELKEYNKNRAKHKLPNNHAFNNEILRNIFFNRSKNEMELVDNNFRRNEDTLENLLTKNFPNINENELIKFSKSQTCFYCDLELPKIPFDCNFCGASFCGQHRLPETHKCINLFLLSRNAKFPDYTFYSTILNRIEEIDSILKEIVNKIDNETDNEIDNETDIEIDNETDIEIDNKTDIEIDNKNRDNMFYSNLFLEKLSLLKNLNRPGYIISQILNLDYEILDSFNEEQYLLFRKIESESYRKLGFENFFMRIYNYKLNRLCSDYKSAIGFQKTLKANQIKAILKSYKEIYYRLSSENNKNINDRKNNSIYHFSNVKNIQNN